MSRRIAVGVAVAVAVVIVVYAVLYLNRGDTSSSESSRTFPAEAPEAIRKPMTGVP